MKLKDFISWYEKLVPLEIQEDFDNSGIQFGNLNREINKILISLDLDDNCLNRAIREKYDLIFTHHPVIFHPLKNIIEQDNSVNTRLISAIKNEICIYSSHTNLDSVEFGVSDALAKQLGLTNTKILDSHKNNIGISEENKPKIFERFYRVDDCRNTKENGYGLGLSIVKNYADIIGADISVNSKLNLGTVMMISFNDDIIVK